MWCLSFHHSTFPLFTNKDFFIQGRKVLGCIQIWRAAIKRLNEIKPTFIILEWCIHTNQPCLLNHLVIVYWVCMEFQGVYVGHVNRELSRSIICDAWNRNDGRERKAADSPTCLNIRSGWDWILIFLLLFNESTTVDIIKKSLRSHCQ